MLYNPEDLRELVLRVLGQYRGDDLYRAKAAFRDCTQEEMQQQYGESGRTRAQIVEGYAEHVAKVDAAIAWVRGRP